HQGHHPVAAHARPERGVPSELRPGTAVQGRRVQRLQRADRDHRGRVRRGLCRQPGPGDIWPHHRLQRSAFGPLHGPVRLLRKAVLAVFRGHPTGWPLFLWAPAVGTWDMANQSAGHWRTANEHFARADWPSARRSLQAILAAEPDHPAALLQLSYVESHLGNYRAARTCALRARLSGAWRHPRLLMDLLPRLRTINEAQVMFEVIDSLPPPEQLEIPLLLAIATQLSYFNLQERADRYLAEALAADPDYPPTLLASARVSTFLGRFDEARSHLERCIARAPDLAQGYWQLSQLRRATPESNHVARLRELLARGGGAEPDRAALLAYALHKELDDLGDHAAAAEALDLACRSKRSRIRYDSAETARLFDALAALD